MSALDIRIHDISKHYGPVTALDSVSLNVDQGEFVTLLGPSGSGKTTLLMVVAGFAMPDAGTISIGKHDITHTPPYRRGIGVVFQNYALFPHMTVRENIEFPLRMRGIPRSKRRRMADHSIGVVRLDGLSNRMPSQLSGGQKQRVALARAMVFNPPVLLMDEPLSALDKKLREHMQLELKDLQQRLGITVLYVTHDQQEALTLSSRIAVINHGRVEQFDRSARIYDMPANRFVAEFIGETNLFPSVALKTDGGRMVAHLKGCGDTEARACSMLQPGQKGYLSVRPEKLVFVNGSATDICTLKGRLENIIHQGDSIKYFIRPDTVDTAGDGGMIVMKIHNRGDNLLSRTGETICFGWRPRDATFVA